MRRQFTQLLSSCNLRRSHQALDGSGSSWPHTLVVSSGHSLSRTGGEVFIPQIAQAVLIPLLQESYNKAISVLNPLFEKHHHDAIVAGDKNYSEEEDDDDLHITGRTQRNSKKQRCSKTSWRWTSFAKPESCSVFRPGIVDLSPGWFMNRHEVSEPIISCIFFD
jgi:hypothetical protein